MAAAGLGWARRPAVPAALAAGLDLGAAPAARGPAGPYPARPPGTAVADRSLGEALANLKS